jgi:HEPN domain-containing protein
MDFFGKKARQFAAMAKQFFVAAECLSAAQRKEGHILFLPTLTLAGQGLELMLKGCMQLNGNRTKNTHDIASLWSKDVNEPLRVYTLQHAHLIADYDRECDAYEDIPSKAEASEAFNGLIQKLCELHGKKEDYPLRYPTEVNEQGPSTLWLIKTLLQTSDDLVKRPSQFKSGEPHYEFHLNQAKQMLSIDKN